MKTAKGSGEFVLLICAGLPVPLLVIYVVSTLSSCAASYCGYAVKAGTIALDKVCFSTKNTYTVLILQQKHMLLVLTEMLLMSTNNMFSTRNKKTFYLIPTLI